MKFKMGFGIWDLGFGWDWDWDLGFGMGWDGIGIWDLGLWDSPNPNNMGGKYMGGSSAEEQVDVCCYTHKSPYVPRS